MISFTCFGVTDTLTPQKLYKIIGPIEQSLALIYLETISQSPSSFCNGTTLDKNTRVAEQTGVYS